MRRFFPIAVGFLLNSAILRGEEATWYRAVNLNGPAATIEGRPWEAGASAKDFKAEGKTFENQKVPLKPPTKAERTQMIRSSVWGSEPKVEFSQVPAGVYQVFLYVWEDNRNEQFELLVNGKGVMKDFNSGSAGMWKRLGPWKTTSDEGKLVVSAKAPSHGAANFSGVEIWAGEGAIPGAPGTTFLDDPTPDQLSFFERRIRPILAENCYECHSLDAAKLKGGLVLDSRAGIRKGGDTGPAITPGDPDASLLVLALRQVREELSMPPKKKLSAEVLADIETWVKMGAPDPRDTDTVAALEEREAIAWDEAREWWSFQPLTAPPVPAVKNTQWPTHDIDHFVLARLEQENLGPAADAERRALIRRATYDLTGLPPIPEEVAAFLSDNSDKAFEKVIDRLLESPRYGERWGRHWLDVVRYADTAGDNSDFPIPQIHRYRDWVIDAFNRDLPYDEFVRDQLAGDLLGGATEEERYHRIVATGYIANSRRFGSRVEDYPQHLTIEDTLDNLGRSFLGLTVSCARCHDHKFDPVTNQDYYALYGVFHSTRYPWPGIELDKKQRDFVPLVPAAKLAEAETARKARESEMSRLSKEAEKLKNALKDTPAPEKTKAEARLKSAEKALADFQKQDLPFELVYAVAESTHIGDVPVQEKGDPARLGAVVPRRFLTLFGGDSLPSEAKGSGRAELADWILADDNPLPARVMANRLWQHHFGKGIVPTPNDFGKQGKLPTHPELLDYLATTFRDGGWSVKAMHRLIMLSRTYRMATTRSDEAIARDPANELLAGFPQLRLDAESIRDTLLALGGNLDLSEPGAHPFPPQSEWKYTQHNPFKDIYETHRRSVFLMTQRIQRHPYLAIFDGADPSASTPSRPTSTTPLQALFLLNDPFVHEQARWVADRLRIDGPDDTSRIGSAYERLFSRPPAEEESLNAAAFLESARAQLTADGTPSDQVEAESWRALVRVLFRLNEFVYLD